MGRPQGSTVGHRSHVRRTKNEGGTPESFSVYQPSSPQLLRLGLFPYSGSWYRLRCSIGYYGGCFGSSRPRPKRGSSPWHSRRACSHRRPFVLGGCSAPLCRIGQSAQLRTWFRRLAIRQLDHASICCGKGEKYVFLPLPAGLQ